MIREISASARERGLRFAMGRGIRWGSVCQVCRESGDINPFKTTVRARDGRLVCLRCATRLGLVIVTDDRRPARPGRGEG